eukprot:1429420-Rhodomonas_salina.1
MSKGRPQPRYKRGVCAVVRGRAALAGWVGEVGPAMQKKRHPRKKKRAEERLVDSRLGNPDT